MPCLPILRIRVIECSSCPFILNQTYFQPSTRAYLSPTQCHLVDAYFTARSARYSRSCVEGKLDLFRKRTSTVAYKIYSFPHIISPLLIPRGESSLQKKMHPEPNLHQSPPSASIINTEQICKRNCSPSHVFHTHALHGSAFQGRRDIPTSHL